MDTPNVRLEPPPRQFQYDVFRPEPLSEHELVVLAEFYEAYEMHWILQGKGFSQACTSDTGQCRWCDENHSKRWRGYLWVQRTHLTGKQAFCFLEFPQGSRDQLVMCLSNCIWIGERIRVRKGKGKTSPLTVWKPDFMQKWSIPPGYPTNRKVLPVLQDLWAKSRAKFLGEKPTAPLLDRLEGGAA